jgi:UDP-N-acetylmuramoylalanine--D-glutamate ligase
VQALREFTGLPHRSQWIADVRGVRYVNDSKGTNVGATLAAVAGMPGSLVLIAGGKAKARTSRRSLRRSAARSGTSCCSGKTRSCSPLRWKVSRASSLRKTWDDAVQRAARAARSGETVLLSPACASFDMFRDYAHRGYMFAASVRRLEQ